MKKFIKEYHKVLNRKIPVKEFILVFIFSGLGTIFCMGLVQGVSRFPFSKFMELFLLFIFIELLIFRFLKDGTFSERGLKQLTDDSDF